MEEALSDGDGSGPARKKKLKPVEYKGNFIGGKKAIRDKLFKRARGSRALQNATTLLLYLIQHSAWQGKRDKHKTYDHWYGKKKKIVASRSQEQIAMDLGVSVRSFRGGWTCLRMTNSSGEKTKDERTSTFLASFWR